MSGESTRIVYGNETSHVASDDRQGSGGGGGARASRFVHNRISNTKYTVLTFLPKNLREQFSQNMNRYFLLIACLQLFRAITPVDPITTWAPLFVIFAISAIKEGVDDYRRAVADRAWNHKFVTVVRSRDHARTGHRTYATVAIHSEDVCVGDVVLVRDGEECCADMVLLKTSSAAAGAADATPTAGAAAAAAAAAGADASDSGGVAYIQTANVDGETNLKPRLALPVTQQLSVAQVQAFGGTVECPTPNAHIYSFDATLRLSGSGSGSGGGGGALYSLSSAQLLLQATTLRNTRWAYGVVVYTGNETKINQNRTTHVPRKWTQLDKAIDRATLVIFCIQLGLTLTLGVVGIAVDRETGPFGADAHWYLRKHDKDGDAWYSGLVIPLRFLLLASMMVPISLKVTLDVCKLFYSLVVGWDLHLYDAPSNQPARAANTSIGEDLGCVGYVLTDKTGTLTENEMVFRRCAVLGQLFGDAPDADGAAATGAAAAAAVGGSVNAALPVAIAAPAVVGGAGGDLPVAIAVAPASAAVSASDVFNDASLLRAVRQGDAGVLQLLRHMALCNTCVPSLPGEGGAGASPFDDETNSSGADRKADIKGAVSTADPNARGSPGAAAAAKVTYASSSPDELALVDAAKRLGVTLTSRDRKSLTLRVATGADADADADGAATIETYEILHVLDFTSDRKRMSVIVRHTDARTGVSRVSLWCKGADDRVLERLSGNGGDNSADAKSSSASTSSTAERLQFFRPVLDRYARHGLRTLCYAYRPIPDDVYTAWAATLARANTTVGGSATDRKHAADAKSNTTGGGSGGLTARERAVFDCYDAIERDLTLVGVSGIEDRLQPGVRDTIASLRRAGIKVWMLTGDKYQTALEISRACALVTSADTALSVVAHTFEEVRDQVRTHLDTVRAARAASSRAGGGGDGFRYAVLVDGVSLALCLQLELVTDFVELTTGAASVVCCRVTPSQKADVVSLVKAHALAGTSTVAIGDGGNDVPMIQRADVGVGIYGKEGLQAARAADYSVSRFRFLLRLVLVHGRYAYSRTSFIASYCFYKSLFICLIQLLYGFYSMFSGASFLDSFSLMSYNIFYTSLPVVFFVLEKDVPERVLLRNPALYQRFPNPHPPVWSSSGSRSKTSSASSGTDDRVSQAPPRACPPASWRHICVHSNIGFTPISLAWWALTALFQSLIVLTFTLSSTHGGPVGLALGNVEQTSTALVAYTACVVVQTLMISLETGFVTRYNAVIIWGTLFVFFVLNWIAGAVPKNLLYHVFSTVTSDTVFWLRVILLATCCLLPVFVAKVAKQLWYPSPAEKARRADLIRRDGRLRHRAGASLLLNGEQQHGGVDGHDQDDDYDEADERDGSTGSGGAGGNSGSGSSAYHRMPEPAGVSPAHQGGHHPVSRAAATVHAFDTNA